MIIPLQTTQILQVLKVPRVAFVVRSIGVHPDCDEFCHTEEKPIPLIEESSEVNANFFRFGFSSEKQGRKGGREEEREEGKKGGREDGKKGGREEGRKNTSSSKTTFIPHVIISSKSILIRNQFHPKTTFIPNHFHPKTTFIPYPKINFISNNKALLTIRNVQKRARQLIESVFV